MDSKRQQTINRYKTGLYTIMLIVVASIINVFLITFADSYMLFCSFFTMMLTTIIAEISSSFWWLSLIIGIITLAPYVVCFVFGRKHYGFMIAALVLFAADTAILLVLMIMSGGLQDSVMDIIIHIVVLVELVLAVISHKAVKFMKEDKFGLAGAPQTITEPVSVLDDDRSVDDEPLCAKMRNITVTRKKAFAASLAGYNVVIDGVAVGTLKNGKSLTLSISGGAHSLSVQFFNGSSDILQIPRGVEDKKYIISTKSVFSGVLIDISEQED